MKESRKQQQCVLDWPRGGTYLLLVEGKGSQNSQLFFLCKVPISPWLLLPSNSFKSRRGDRWVTGVGEVSLGRLAVH